MEHVDTDFGPFLLWFTQESMLLDYVPPSIIGVCRCLEANVGPADLQGKDWS